MSDRRKFLLTIFWAVMLVTVAVISVLSISYSTSRAEKTGSSMVVEINSTHEDQSKDSLVSLEKPLHTEVYTSHAQFPLSQVVNGIEIELLNVQETNEKFYAELCYQLPNDQDWLLGDRAEDVILTDGEFSIPMTGYSMIDLQTSSDGVPTKRCDKITFPITKSQDLSHITITVHRLVTSVPEVPDCELAQKKLDAEGIIIQCNTTEGFFGYEVIQKPGSLTDAQASNIVHDSFMDIVSGPWFFEVILEK